MYVCVCVIYSKWQTLSDLLSIYPLAYTLTNRYGVNKKIPWTLSEMNITQFGEQKNKPSKNKAVWKQNSL